MNILNVVIIGLVLGSASGAAFAVDIDGSDARPKLLDTKAGQQQGCGDCPPDDGNESEEPEQNETAPPEEPPAEPEPEPVVIVEEIEPVIACGAGYEFSENGTFFRSALGRHDSAPGTWEFPVDCVGAQVEIRLTLTNYRDLAYLEFDNQMEVYDGNGTQMAQIRSGLSVDVAGEHLMFSYLNDGAGVTGDWLFDVRECGLIGDYSLSITVS